MMPPMSDHVTLRPSAPQDAETTARICYEAFAELNRRHHFPPDFPDVNVARGLMDMMLQAPFVWGIVAEHKGKVVGSNFLWEFDPIAGVGPVTVDPAAQHLSVGRRMMEALMQRVQERQLPGVRLVQAAFNTRSMSLYTKLGYDVREPLLCLQGQAIGESLPGYAVRPATQDDLSACAAVCRTVHGHERTGELAAATARGSARVVEHADKVVGYATEIGFFGHCVAETNHGVMALISAAESFTGPGFLIPSRNGELLRWCLAKGLKNVQPMTLMSHGLYNEPRGAFLPSILY
jgi:GNAT superfamily N-acetyltransferase